MLKTVLLAAVTVGTVLAVVPAANAAQGCGPGFRRDAYGRCYHPRYGPGYGPAYGPGPLVIDTFYPGRGYWDGHRYWWHRDRFNGGWRYR